MVQVNNAEVCTGGVQWRTVSYWRIPYSACALHFSGMHTSTCTRYVIGHVREQHKVSLILYLSAPTFQSTVNLIAIEQRFTTMQLLTDETRIRRRKRAASHTKHWSAGPTKFLLLLVTLPLLLLFVMVTNTHDGKGGRGQRNGTDKHQQYIISPEALRSRSQKIIERTRHKKETSFRSRLGSPDHPRQIHLRTDTAKRQSEALTKKTKPKIAEILSPRHSHVIPNVLIFTHYHGKKDQ